MGKDAAASLKGLVAGYCTLGAALDSVEGKVDPDKLDRLRVLLSDALPRPTSEVPSDDPILVRRQLARLMMAKGASRGNVQAMEQFFMGVMRRAALEGFAAPPPEGPWTRSWQHVLDLMEPAPRGRAACRALAGWATLQDVEPPDVNDGLLSRAAAARVIEEADAPLLREYLSAANVAVPAELASDAVRTERLRRKAEVGSTTDRHVHRGKGGMS